MMWRFEYECPELGCRFRVRKFNKALIVEHEKSHDGIRAVQTGYLAAADLAAIIAELGVMQDELATAISEDKPLRAAEVHENLLKMCVLGALQTYVRQRVARKKSPAEALKESIGSALEFYREKSTEVIGHE